MNKAFKWVCLVKWLVRIGKHEFLKKNIKYNE
jgi:hypothetical protein